MSFEIHGPMRLYRGVWVVDFLVGRRRCERGGSVVACEAAGEASSLFSVEPSRLGGRGACTVLMGRLLR